MQKRLSRTDLKKDLEKLVTEHRALRVPQFGDSEFSDYLTGYIDKVFDAVDVDMNEYDAYVLDLELLTLAEMRSKVKVLNVDISIERRLNKAIEEIKSELEALQYFKDYNLKLNEIIKLFSELGDIPINREFRKK
ncbi:MAG: hypothetical protein V3T30_00575, partial [Thermodesulfobacteriota bacterium]